MSPYSTYLPEKMTWSAPKTFLLFSLLFSVVLSCEKRTEQENRLIGAWRLQQSRGANTLLSFQEKGAFEVDHQIDGNLTNPGGKQGKASGTWELDSATTRLTMVTLQGNPQIGWPAQSGVYPIVTFDGLTLHLMTPDGQHSVWKKIPQSPGGSAKDKESATVKMAPLVVNLAPSTVSAHNHYRWICTEVQIMLNNYDITSDLHPRVYEKTIFFFNSKTYDQMNTLDKLATTAEELKKALNPYLDHRISHLSFNNTILTGRPEAVEQFMAKYKTPEAEAPKKH
ncbi:MAG: flagellar basal body-associated FliL family protein [Pseudomonadota bacterium]